MDSNEKNFTGKVKLTDVEFLSYYDELWEKSSHRNNYPKPEEVEKNKIAGELIYNSDEENLKNEKWEPLPSCESYQVSTLGRVKYNNKIVKQYDYGKIGYLRLDKEEKNVDHYVTVYTLVAKTFLQKKEGDGYDVHHIVNNGYDNRLSNLILLTREQHNAVHSDKKYSLAELQDILKLSIL